MIDWAPPMMTGLTVIAALWYWRASATRAHEARMRQLHTVAESLHVQADSIGRVLGHAAVPDVVKQALVAVSAKLGDREFMVQFATLLIERGGVPRSDDGDEVMAALSQLRVNDPDSYDAFIQATVLGVFAALLRWPETARVSEQAIARLVSHQRRDVDVLVAASRSHAPGLPFGVRTDVPAAA